MRLKFWQRRHLVGVPNFITPSVNFMIISTQRNHPHNPSFFLSVHRYFLFNTRKKGHQKATEMVEFKANVAQIESSKPALEALLKRVLELESKLSKARNKLEIFASCSLTYEPSQKDP
jgi:hypothetical protein